MLGAAKTQSHFKEGSNSGIEKSTAPHAPSLSLHSKQFTACLGGTSLNLFFGGLKVTVVLYRHGSEINASENISQNLDSSTKAESL